jgi:hypothetical protein
MTDSPIYGILLAATSQDDVYDTINDAILAIETANDGAVTHDLSAGDVNVTAAQLQGYRLHFAAAQTGGDTITFTAPSQRIVLVKNTGAMPLNVIVGATTETLAGGALGIYYLDGTANGLTELAEI